MVKNCKFCSNKLNKITINLPFFSHFNFQTKQNKNILFNCPNCHITHNFISQNDLFFFKSKKYSQSSQTSHKIKIKKNIFQTRSFLQAQTIKKILKDTDKTYDFLDYGCFDGRLLKELGAIYKKSNFYGHDVNKKVKKFFPYKKNFYFINFEKELKSKFDFVIFSHSMMYIKNINIILDKIIESLKSTGIIFIQMPDISENPFYSLMDDQFYFFDKKNLYNLSIIKKLNFKLIKNNYFKREFIVLYSKDYNNKLHKLVKSNIYANAIKKVNNFKNKLLTNFHKLNLIGVMGSTINAAFVDEILKSKVKFFIDENCISKKKFRNKAVLHPINNKKNDFIILPYNYKNMNILNNFKKKYKGMFNLVR